jgi:hypothetical protein
MSNQICTHLENYAAQYAQAAAAYEACLAAVDAMMSSGPEGGRAESARKALAAWRAEDENLKQQLVELVAEGRVRVPREMVRSGAGRSRRGRSHLVCASCRQRVPRLAYPEWRFAHNGVVTYRGEELSLPDAVGV